jgi:hypothetical protein
VAGLLEAAAGIVNGAVLFTNKEPTTTSFVFGMGAAQERVAIDRTLIEIRDMMERVCLSVLILIVGRER